MTTKVTSSMTPEMSPEVTPGMTQRMTPIIAPSGPATQLPYSGSDALSFLVPYIGLDIDKINYVVCSFVTLCLAFVFAKVLPPSPANARWRHTSSLIIGISLIAFCFGWQTIHLLLQTWVCYLIMKYMEQDQQHTYSLAFTLVYTTAIHLHRMTYNYGCEFIDISGPMMICTQKLTYLSFSLRDGAVLGKESKDKELSTTSSISSSSSSSSLTTEQTRLSVGSVPSLFEVSSFVFYFPTVMAGPLYSFNEFKDYMNGADIRATFGGNEGLPSAKRAISSKVAQAIISASFICALQEHFPFSIAITPEFASFSLYGKIAVTIICTHVHRFRFYFAWSMAEACCNMAGFGWQLDDKARDGVRWDKVSNINIFEVETATNLKGVTDSWNKQTGVWLRRICYERSTTYGTLKTFLLSALWHGVYPGYYVSFVEVAILVQVARRLRRLCRPYFLESVWRKTFYDFVTWLTTTIFMTHAMMPFALLELKSAVYYYNCFGWVMHMIVAFVILFFAVTPPIPSSSKIAVSTNAITNTNTNTNINNNIKNEHSMKNGVLRVEEQTKFPIGQNENKKMA